MTHIATKVLDYALENELDLPDSVDIYGLMAEPNAAFEKAGSLTIYHPIKAEHDTLKAKYPEAKPLCSLPYVAQPSCADIVIVYLTKHKKQNLFHIGLGLHMLRPNGRLVCAGSNDIGAQRFEKSAQKLGLDTQSIFKFKARCFWVEKPLDTPLPKIHNWIEEGQAEPIPGTDLVTQPGIFGHGKIDKGSQILIDCLKDTPLNGLGADFGMGYGYLAYTLFKQGKVQKLIGFEHDHLAIDCARQNLESYSKKPDTVLSLLWHDILRDEIQAESFDWIVMNPPFHNGEGENRNIGLEFIKKAHQALKPDGILYMVANTHLPYDKPLEDIYTHVQRVHEGGGYKVFIAKK